MFDFIKNQLTKKNIELVSCISLEECEIKRPYLLQRHGIESGSVIIFAVPYLSRELLKKRNVSAYASARDYHLFFAELFEELIQTIKENYPSNKFCGFTDHSPINEIDAAAKCSLGVVGRNHLLITKEYSSYVFIGEIITDACLPSFAGEIKHCLNCGICEQKCPVKMKNGECLSALTQKKGELSDEEKASITAHQCAWGCDICQEVCPHTRQAIENETIFTNIEFFKTSLTPFLNSEQIENMSDSEFNQRAYSWRGKNVILRNLKYLEGKES